ncbi:spliceosome ATPase-activating subunit SPP2 [Sporobolomyces koalae]|uniref:spliceosome ATPase-activating subunit SPP2 n=1 Tax=Sporobolomyces koalae TaxID=500713 RepID=UPI00316D84FA
MSGISFKISAPNRPTSNAAPSRPSNGRHSSHRGDGDSQDDSEDDHDAFRRSSGGDSKRRKVQEEEVTAFGRDGATSKHAKAKPAAPLVIPALANKDWRKAAEELRAGRNAGRNGKKREMYLPEQGGGMRMREGPSQVPSVSEADADAINTEEVVGGLEKREKRNPPPQAADNPPNETPSSVEAPSAVTAQPKTQETEEQRALRELLGEGGSTATAEEVSVEAIYSAEDARNGPIEEADALKRDVESRPDEASLDDYARVPVGAFGLAMLRGMGWQPGQAASRSGRGAIEAHVPSSRPALLGIGAKPMAEAIGSTGGDKSAKSKSGSGPMGKSRREEMKFVPLVKQARESSASGRSTPLPVTDGSRASSQRHSRSPPPASSTRRERERSPRRDRDRDGYRRSRYDDDLDGKSKSRPEEDDRRGSRREDDRRRSRYDEDDRRSSRRDDRDARRYRDDRESYRDERRKRDDRGSRDRR